MKVLLITMAWPNYGEYNLYSDLMEEFNKQGHKVTVLGINDRNQRGKTYRSIENGVRVIRVKTGSIQKTNKYKKVIFSFLAGLQMLIAAFRYLRNERFDLILFSTPPITLTPAVVFLKHWYHGKLYLLLKDIWPQDTVDLGGMRKGGIVWGIFRMLEKMTYNASDYIGCMSPANVSYLQSHNRFHKNKIIEVCPNSMKKRAFFDVERDEIREKYHLPKDKVIFLYGGNLGKSQGLKFLMEIVEHYRNHPKIFFLITGSGTEYGYLERGFKKLRASNVKLMPSLSPKEYEILTRACDVGLIFLHQNSTVPNFPSRLLSYLTAKLPVIAAVDTATDIGTIVESAGCGFQAFHGNLQSFERAVKRIMSSKELRSEMGERGYQLFLTEYTAEKSYEIIMKHFNRTSSVR
ncbi:MAG: glycosyl transferase group 1 [Herbinix sp.]|jgi:glycosyltransferase involved in cell wall biosynthesis|nr:glycosyl transferase group 1 [Herbinix sp.]